MEEQLEAKYAVGQEIFYFSGTSRPKKGVIKTMRSLTGIPIYGIDFPMGYDRCVTESYLHATAQEALDDCHDYAYYLKSCKLEDFQ